jgi:hypothetical protein
MTREQLLTFGATWSYSFLALPGAPLRHGKDAYEQATPEQLALASERIDRWNALVMSEHLDQTISIIDEMLKSCRVERTPQESEMVHG